MVAGTRLCLALVETVLITLGFFRYCWSGLALHQGLFPSQPTPPVRRWSGVWGWTRSWECGQEDGRGLNQDSWPQLTQGIFQAMQHHAQHIKLEVEEGRGTCLEGQYLSPQVTMICDGALLPWEYWASACLWEVVDELLVLLCLCKRLLLYWLNCL